MLSLLASLKQWGRLVRLLPLLYSKMRQAYYEYKSKKITEGVRDAEAPMSDDELAALNRKLYEQRKKHFSE